MTVPPDTVDFRDVYIVSNLMVRASIINHHHTNTMTTPQTGPRTGNENEKTTPLYWM
jgi:hypothetical protein